MTQDKVIDLTKRRLVSLVKKNLLMLRETRRQWSEAETLLVGDERRLFLDGLASQLARLEDARMRLALLLNKLLSQEEIKKHFPPQRDPQPKRGPGRPPGSGFVFGDMRADEIVERYKWWHEHGFNHQNAVRLAGSAGRAFDYFMVKLDAPAPDHKNYSTFAARAEAKAKRWAHEHLGHSKPEPRKFPKMFAALGVGRTVVEDAIARHRRELIGLFGTRLKAAKQNRADLDALRRTVKEEHQSPDLMILEPDDATVQTSALRLACRVLLFSTKPIGGKAPQPRRADLEATRKFLEENGVKEAKNLKIDEKGIVTLMKPDSSSRK